MSQSRTTLSAFLVAALALSLLAVAPPRAQAQEQEGHVLIFTETASFRHTEAIAQGVPILEAAFEDVGITSEHTEDSSIFNDDDLDRFDALVMFQTSGDPWTADEKAAMERYQQAGGGIVAIHNAADMNGNYAWWDNLIGSLMPGHAATGTSPGLPGTVRVEDQVHPSTEHLPLRWDRADEWYNFSQNVRGEAHVLATVDESTYEPGSNAMGYDHPISWCKPYDGGRAWVTAMGHFGAHYQEEGLVQHIVGGVEWAAGLAEGDCGGTKWDEFEKIALDDNTSAPFALDVAPDGRVFFTELVRGQIRVYDPQTHTVTTAITIPVYSGGEDGLLGITLHPQFEDNGWLYVYYSPASSDDTDPANFFNRLSRFTVTPGTSTIDPASEAVIIDVPARRLPDEPGHTGGDVAFDLEGNLLLSVGDDVNPHSEPSGGYAPLSTREGTFHDARETSANTNDLRGKLLRITPGDDGGYTIPAGNMFEPGTPDTLPEIYAMGFRNPFRFSVDPETGWIGLADYGPDNGSNNDNRGPAGMVEWNLIKEPGFFGWPLCHGDNRPYRDVDYTTSPVTVGDYFDCDNPINDSPRNTGLVELPPVQEPELAYGYQMSTHPGAIAPGGGLAPMGGPFYDYDPDSPSDTKFPEYYDGTAFFYEWSKNRVFNLILDREAGELEKVNSFMPPPAASWLAPQDMEFGPDGSLYTLEWGGGFGRDNPNSGIYRVDYISGSRSPIALANATPDSGQAPLEVAFSSQGSRDPEGDALSYEWDFDGDGETDSTVANPTHVFNDNGVYQVRLTVTDSSDKTGSTIVPVTVGNTRPVVEFDVPPDGAFFNWGDEISWEVTVTDPEDGEVDYSNVIVQPALGHDAHAHPLTGVAGKTGSVVTSLGGHEETENIFMALDARYSDEGGNDVGPLTGSETIVLRPKRLQAEHHQAVNGAGTGPATDIEGGGEALTGLGTGDWSMYEPVNFTGIDALTFRVASASEGGTIELRQDSPQGELLGTAEVPDTGGAQDWADVTIDAPDTTESMSLYLVYTGEASFSLNFLDFDGQGISPTTRPDVALTSPTANQEFPTGAEVELTAEATDAANDIELVEFFAGDDKIGEDAEAPYTFTWTDAPDGYHTVRARATNSEGLSSYSRYVRILVGDLLVKAPFKTFTNREAEFEQYGPDSFMINSQGANTWQGTDQYGSIYQSGVGERFMVTVRLDAQEVPNGSAKAGLISRNDITAPGNAGGYFLMHRQGNGNYEALWDANGDGDIESAEGAPAGAPPRWLRIQREGTTFIGSYSADGVEWTELVEVDLASADGQPSDVGMFVTAHHSTAFSRAEFSNFSLDTNPPAPEPEPEPEPEPGAPAPSCLGARSDDFSGDALDLDRWTVVRGADGGLYPQVSDGQLVLPVTSGDINEGGSGPIAFVGQPMPDGEWQATAKVTIDHDNEWQHFALMQHVDDDNYVKFAFTQNNAGGRFFEFQTETNGSRQWHGDNVDVSGDFPTTVWMRLSSDGESLNAAYSTDGEDWTALSGTGSVLDGGNLGLMAAGDTDAHNVDALVDEFVFTPDELPEHPGVDDEFDGDALDGCRWNRIVRWDGDHVEVADGQLHIETQPGDINGGANNDPNNFILQDVPEGDWTVETKMTAPLLHRWQLAGFMLHSDDDHYVKLDVVAHNAPGAERDLRVELRKEEGGPLTGPGGTDISVPESEDDTWWLRLTKHENTYTGQISGDGETWIDVPGSVTADLEDPALGLMAIGPEQTEPVTVSFDHFRVLDEQPQPELPTVTSTLDPTEPNGAAGWYTSPVTLTVEADDAEADVEVNTGDGWVAYEGPVTFEEDGEHTVQFRASNAAGTSEVGSASFDIDATAPEASAEVEGDGTESATVTLSADDATSGASEIHWRLAGGEDAVYDGPLSFSEPGTYEVQFRASDAAGNVSDWQSVTVTVTEPDACPDGDDRETVVIAGRDTGVANVDLGDGCTIADVIDEDGDYRNHGAFVSHVSELTEQLLADGVIEGRERGAIISAAARANAGKPSRR